MTFPRPGYTFSGGLERAVWTPAGFLDRGESYVLRCHNGHEAHAPLQALVDAGHGDKPMSAFTGRWRCSYCDSKWVEVSLLSAAGERR